MIGTSFHIGHTHFDIVLVNGIKPKIKTYSRSVSGSERLHKFCVVVLFVCF